MVGLVSAGLLLILMNTTTPSTIGAIGILCVFFLGYVAIVCFLTTVIWGFVKLARKMSGKARVFRKIANMQLKEVYYYSTVVSFAPVIIVSLQSVDGINPYELGLVVLLVILGCVYIYKRKS